MTNAYEEAYRRSIEDPEGFWGEAAEAITWTKKWDKVLDDSNAPFYRWFAGGELNTCYNAVDRHVDNGPGRSGGHHLRQPGDRHIKTYHLRELQDRVARFAGVLADLGVVKGDRVIVYMPMVPEAAIAMLACARIGAIHSVVFGGFSARELATRIDDAKPKVIVAGSCGIEPNRIVPYKPLLDDAIEQAAHKPDAASSCSAPQEPAS
jgi:propionyl-CoA synthetase